MTDDPETRNERTLALFFLGVIALFPPLLAIFAIDAAVFGVPLLYGYLFAVWLGIVVLLAWMSGSGRQSGDENVGQIAANPPSGTEGHDR